MKKISILFIIFFFCMVIPASGGVGRGRRGTPVVSYISPENDALIDLSQEKTLVFRWKPAPMPAGGREAFKFSLYKGWEYEVVVSEALDPKVFLKEVPSGLFENGQIYTWQVKQRDARTHDWGIDKRWSFRVKK